MQDQTRKLKALRKLFGQFPEVGGPANETIEARAERMAIRTTGYLTAIDGFAADLVDDGVNLVLKGELPGHDGRFVPTPPMLATACRIAADRNARQRYLAGLSAPRLPAPQIEHSQESRERVRQMAQDAAERIGAVNLHMAEEEIIAAKARWEKVNAHFDPPQDYDSLTSRLHLPRYSVGSPESDGEAA